MAKYDPLEQYLAEQVEDEVVLTFEDIEGIIGDELPQSASTWRPWWGNQSDASNRPQARAWMSAGFLVGAVDQKAGTVRFVRDKF